MQVQTSPKNLTNVRNRVNNLHLPKTKSLYPLFEVISNSIHAIDEAKEEGLAFDKGKIVVKILRISKYNILKEISNSDDELPIDSFEITDNGIGLNENNYKSFQEFDSEYKKEIGGKGIGRLVCLKAFSKLVIKSNYRDNGALKTRSFEFKKTVQGYSDFKEENTDNGIQGTIVTLRSYQSPYKENTPISKVEVARDIIKHFLLYFIQEKQPTIIIKNEDGSKINLTELFESEFKSEILSETFSLGEESFTVYISRSNGDKSHKINYCANERTVKSEGISNFMVDLKNVASDFESDKTFYYQVLVVGDILDSSVNDARTGFNFPDHIDEEGIFELVEIEEITLSKIRKKTIDCIESLLSDYLQRVRNEKTNLYKKVIADNYPNYTSLLTYRRDKIEKLPLGLKDSELDVKLYEIESQWKKEIKEEGIELMDKKKDITTLEEYHQLYGKYLTDLNKVGQSDLARYVIHRRSVIDLLEILIEFNEDNKFASEEIIHNLFFPVRETGDSILTEKQNLWLLDERLTFNSLVASDKLLTQVKEIESDSKVRTDLIIKKEEVFDKAALFSEDSIIFNSFTIVEFKRPNRDNYVYGNPKKDPVSQIRKYVREIFDGKIKKKGRVLEVKENTPFYCYIVADIKPTLKFILEEEGFYETPDGLGFFKFYNTTKYKAYVEVLPYTKIIKDSKQRNKVLFDRLILPSE